MQRRHICVFLFLSILLAAGSCRTPAGRSPSQVIDDAAITTEVKAKLLAEGILKGLAISVSTFEGNVTLTGSVQNQTQKKKAEEIAKGVKGVKKIGNLLEIRP